MTNLVPLALAVGAAAAEYALLGFGFALVFAGCRLFSLAHGVAFLAGGFTALGVIGAGWGVAPAVVLGTLCGGAAGWSQEIAVFGPLARRESGWEAGVLGSLGLHLVAVSMATLWFGASVRFWGPDRVGWGEGLGGVSSLWILSCVLVLGLLAIALRLPGAGAKLRAMAENPLLAETLGVWIRGQRQLVFAVSGLTAGLAGGLRALDTGIEPRAALAATLKGAAAALLAGNPRVLPCVLAGVVLAATEVGLARMLGGGWSEALQYALLVVVVFWRGGSLLHQKGRVERE